MSDKASDSKIILCERFNKHLRAAQHVKGDTVIHRPNPVKRVVLSKNVGGTCYDRKTCSTGVITKPTTNQKVNKTTKSDYAFNSKSSQSRVDYCKKCGDSEPGVKNGGIPGDLYNLEALHRIIHSKRSRPNNQNNLHQHYINKNFQRSAESIPNNNVKKVSLDTITEKSESINGSQDAVFKIYRDSSAEELGFFNTDDADNIKNIKQFRNKNFFECHSAKSRIEHGVASSENHKCIYRFYLNERLFPVPFNMDFNENIRCMECNLPLQNREDVSLNGMIQAKVKLNNKVQDMLVMLPVKKHLIIKERKKDITSQKDMDSVYFGVIKLNLNGDSIFNRTLPSDSLALKYQKGYRKFDDDFNYDYTNLNDHDTVII